GHALRSIDDCRTLAAQDATIYTSLLDARHIAGDSRFVASVEALRDDADVWPPARYLEAKASERHARHARFHDTAYNLEPNLKEGPGGLRALQLVCWLGRRLFGAASFAALAARGLLSAREAEAAERGRRLLSQVRFALHLAAGRGEERLLFDFQRT